MSELASSYNSSEEAMGVYAASYGTASLSNMFPTFPGTSPPQQVSWGGTDMLSSSPLVGPGATFQSLRGRPNSFDHGKQYGPDVQSGISPGGSSSPIAGVMGGIVFDELPLSPFALESGDENVGSEDNAGKHERRDSEDPPGRGPDGAPGEESDEDDDEDDMMFKFDGAVSKRDSYSADPAVAVASAQHEPEATTLTQLLSNLPTLNSFPPLNPYVR
jgi:hypothetical protein